MPEGNIETGVSSRPTPLESLPITPELALQILRTLDDDVKKSGVPGGLVQLVSDIRKSPSPAAEQKKLEKPAAIEPEVSQSISPSGSDRVSPPTKGDHSSARTLNLTGVLDNFLGKCFQHAVEIGDLDAAKAAFELMEKPEQDRLRPQIEALKARPVKEGDNVARLAGVLETGNPLSIAVAISKIPREDRGRLAELLRKK